MASKSRTKRLVMFDVDGTLMNGHSQVLLFGLLKQQGIMPWGLLLRVTLWFMAYKLYLAGNPTGIYRRAYATLGQHTLSDIESLIKENFHKFQAKLFPEAYRFLRQHRQQGDRTMVLSASIEPLVQCICRELGIDEYVATKLERLPTGIFTGRVVGDAMYGQQKVHACKAYLQRSTCNYTQTMFYADHISDLGLLEFVDVPICVNPDPRLRRIAKARQWKILRWGKESQQSPGL
jgi:HAD superfamily hydrolase (TIGR01490 family)